jgi:hypothetical protein
MKRSWFLLEKKKLLAMSGVERSSIYEQHTGDAISTGDEGAQGETAQESGSAEPAGGDVLECFFADTSEWHQGQVVMVNITSKSKSGVRVRGKRNRYMTCTVRPGDCLIHFPSDDTDYVLSLRLENYDLSPDVSDQQIWRYSTTGNTRMSHCTAAAAAAEFQ